MLKYKNPNEMTLDEVWQYCLAKWRWVSKRLPFMEIYSIVQLKEKWLEKKGYNYNTLLNNCFFCEYSNRSSRTCSNCPGRLVDNNFSCNNAEYYWNLKPKEFYLKLRRLNYKRMKGRFTE